MPTRIDPDTVQITRTEIINAADAVYTSLNNGGEGFDPTDIANWTLVYESRTTDEVSIYEDGDDLLLVGTDGMGSDDSRWAVRVPFRVTAE